MTQKFRFESIEKSIFQKIGESDGGMETKLSGIFVTPKGMPTIVMTTMLIRMPPRMPLYCR